MNRTNHVKTFTYPMNFDPFWRCSVLRPKQSGTWSSKSSISPSISTGSTGYNKSKSRKRSANRNQRSVDTSFTTLVPRGPSKTPQFQRLRLARHDLVGQNSRRTVAHGGPYGQLISYGRNLVYGSGGPPVQICKSVGIRNCRKDLSNIWQEISPGRLETNPFATCYINNGCCLGC
jgi:hypothetical protein